MKPVSFIEVSFFSSHDWSINSLLIIRLFSALLYQDAFISQHEIFHDEVIKWKHFPHYWPFVRGIHRSPVNSPHKGQWCWALMFSLIGNWINGWVNNCEAGDLRRHRAHYGVTVMHFIVHLLFTMLCMSLSIELLCCPGLPFIPTYPSIGKLHYPEMQAHLTDWGL